MISEKQFRSLLERVEDEFLDFKATGYDLSQDHGKQSLVKDVLCMSNTPRDESSFIILGVKKHPDGTYDLVGVTSHPDEADLQSQFTDRVYPIPDFTYYPFTYGTRTFGAIEVFPTKSGPCTPVRDYGNSLRQWQVYFRRGSKNDLATPEDNAQILSWFGKPAPTPSAYTDGDPSWERLLRELQDFAPSRSHLLIASPCQQGAHTDLSALGRVPWVGVFDFDPDSDISGLLSESKTTLEAQRSVHLVAPHDHPTLNLRTGTYWFFPRGLSGREGTVERGPWKNWVRTHGARLADQFARLAAELAPGPVSCLALWYEPSLARHLQSALESALQSFGDAVSVVIVTDDATELQKIANESNACLLEIPLHQVCSGMAGLFAATADNVDQPASLPSSSGAPVILPVRDQHWLEEELELVHLGVGLVPPSDRAIGREFLRGAEISWYDLGLHYDIDRDLSEKLQHQVQADLSGRRTSRVNLYHSPGAGGTTVARRVLWNLHRGSPCAILRRTNPPETAERLFNLVHLTGLPIALLVDGATVSEGEIDQLSDILKSRHIPVVLMQVLRRFSRQAEGPRAFYLPAELSLSEARRFAHVFAKEAAGREGELEALVHSLDVRQRSAFYFGLLTFREGFLGLESFVATRLDPLNPIQRNVIGFLALCHRYAQRPLPAPVFADLFGIPHTRFVDLAAAFPAPTLDLLVQVDSGSWRTAHDLLASEVLEQLLSPSTTDRRLWKQGLSGWAIDFAELCRGSGAVASDEMLEVACRTFIYRDNAELLGTERSASKQFARLLEDVPSTEGRLQVLRKLAELYPNEPHFWAHLGRFHSIERREYPEALDCIDHAITLRDDDSVLHHMKGMVLRQQVYQVIEASGLLSDVLQLAKQSSLSFARARELNPEDDHGFISEVQMLARALDYAGRQQGGDVLAYLSLPAADPYLRDCFERAEDLLERVRRNREGQGASSYEQQCRAELDRVYGRHDLALQTWDNLLSRRDVYKPPVRRQIVWTYLARRRRSWAGVSAREADRMVGLLEDNLREEPNSDTNLRLWVQAVRRCTRPPNIEAIIERVGYWRASADSLEALFYLYVLYALEAIEGSSLARDNAIRFVEESQAKARSRRYRTSSFEWLGTEGGIRRLVHHSQLGDWQHGQDFWEHTAPLARLPGRISRIDGPQAGRIEVQGGLPAFFVPARGDYSRGRSENQPVTCYLGFSYDGLRAWEVRNA